MRTPYPGGPRYDTQWADLLDAEMWAAIRHMSTTAAHTYRLAAFFTAARAARP